MLDKVIDSAQLDADLTAVADAIRTKGGTTGELEFPSGFVSAVEGIQAGGGDADPNAIARSILDGTITEYTDNQMTKLTTNAFSYTRIQKVNLPNLIEIGISCFTQSGLIELNCPKVTAIKTNIPGIKVAYFPNIVSMDGGFINNAALTEVYMPLCTRVNGQVFDGCKSLNKVTIGKLTAVPDYAFRRCESLPSDGLDFSLVQSIGYQSFQSCMTIEELNFPVATGNIKGNAFKDCSALRKLTFGTQYNPKTYSLSAGEIFTNCSSLQALIFHVSAVPSLTVTNAFTGSAIADGTGYIYVPSALVDSFKSATNWSAYASQIRAIEDYPDICGEVSA